MFLGLRFVAATCCCCLLLTAAVEAQLEGLRISTIDGRTLLADIDEIKADGTIVGVETPLRIEEITRIEHVDPRSPLDSDSPIDVRLIGGGVIDGDRLELENEVLSVHRGARTTQISLQAIKGIVWNSDVDESIEASIEKPSKENDRVIVEIDGQTRSVEGLLESITEEGVGINYKGKSRSIGIEKVRGIIPADLGVGLADGPRATIDTIIGYRWVGVIRQFKDGQLTLALTDKADVTFRHDLIVGISIYSDRLRYLSDIKPIDVRQKVEFTIARPYQNDKSVAGNPLTLVDSQGRPIVFKKGIGVQSTSELTYANDGFNRLRASVGIDRETRGRGDCEAVIRGDGIELWSRRIQGGNPPEPVDIDISGIEQVTLIVNAGREFDLADHLDWGEIRMLKTK
ncbi:MAG: NPCBM/NEW2 domain-containing protein [Planctomycetota bacterium]